MGEGTASNSGYIEFWNNVLMGIFPIIPWEVFFFMPWALYWLVLRAQKKPDVKYAKLNHLILFVTVFAAVYGGLAHPLGLPQAFDSLAGNWGVCVVHPPPMGAKAFELYKLAAAHTTGDAWCILLALHIIFVSLVGWHFLYTLIFIDRRAAKVAGNKLLLKDPPVSLFYWRSFLWFFVTGLSQAAPYFGAGDHIGDERGGYSKRVFTPAITENLAAWSWIVGGLFYYYKWRSAAPLAQVQPGGSANDTAEAHTSADIDPTVRADIEPTVRADIEPTVRADIEPTVRTSTILLEHELLAPPRTPNPVEPAVGAAAGAGKPGAMDAGAEPLGHCAVAARRETSNAFALMAAGQRRQQQRQTKRRRLSAGSGRGGNHRPSEHPVLGGQYTFSAFVSPEEEAELLTFVDQEPGHAWKRSGFNGPHLSKLWGVRTDLGARDATGFRPAVHAMPEAFRGVIDRIRALPEIPELRSWRPNEANAIAYHRDRGHMLGDHCDHRSLSGPILVNLSLAGDAVMTYTKDGGSEAVRVRLPRRSLQVQMGTVRFSYQHGIRAADLPDPPGRRVSITFRQNVSGMGFYDEGGPAANM